MQLTPRRTVPLLLALVTTTMLATGCADGKEVTGMPEQKPTSPSAGPSEISRPSAGTPIAGSGRPTGGPSESAPPVWRPPTAPPKNPTDTGPTNVVVGHITRGGSGPCYGVVTDDGREYALYGPDAGTFAVGTRVRATTGPLLVRIHCGTGTPAAIVKIGPVG